MQDVGTQVASTKLSCEMQDVGTQVASMKLSGEMQDVVKCFRFSGV